MMQYEEIITWWQSEKKETIADIYTLLDNFRILFAYHSGKIENDAITLHDTREIFESGSVVNYTGDLRTLFEIKNQKECFDYIVRKILQKEEISIGFILELHRTLMQGCYDEIRYHKGEYDKTGKIDGFVEFLKEQMVKTWDRKKRHNIKLSMFL